MYNQDSITRAWFFASKAHKGQIYPRGELPYITHIGNVMMEVMGIASTIKNPELAIICAILHDTIEDTDTTHEELIENFSKEVADGVLALSKNERLATKREQMLDSLKRIKEQPQEVWIVKMADRVSNLGKPPHYWKAEKIKAYQEEAQIIFDYLHSANESMAKRLLEKMEAYNRYNE